MSHWQAYTHGDLHADNVYADQHGRTCIIDYEKSGPGYILRDFVELETDIRLRLLPLKAKDLLLAYRLDLLLLEPAVHGDCHARRISPALQSAPGSTARRLLTQSVNSGGWRTNIPILARCKNTTGPC